MHAVKSVVPTNSAAPICLAALPACLLLLPALLLLLQFRSNMAEFRVPENTQLLLQFRDNILAIINAMEAMGGVMAQMPQLPVRCVAGRRPTGWAA